MADDFQLDPLGVEHLARHVGGGDGLFHGVAAGGVGQDQRAEVLDDLPKGLTLAAAALAAQRHRGDSCVRRAEGLCHDRGRGV